MLFIKIKLIIEWNYTYFGILIASDVLPWECLIFVIEESGKSLYEFIISYNTVDIVWEVYGTLSADNKGQHRIILSLCRIISVQIITNINKRFIVSHD